MQPTLVRFAVMLLALTSNVGLVQQGASRPPEAAIAGRVVDAVSGAAIPGAIVSLSGRFVGAPPTRTIETGSSGQFSFTLGGKAEAVRVSAAKPGYLGGFVGQLGPTDHVVAGRSFDVGADERLEGVLIRMWPQGIINGTVTDERDEPVVGAMVMVLTRIYTGAGSRWSRANAGVVRTDDRGLYSIFRLPPGDYVVVVRGVRSTYSPSSLRTSDARVITIAPGDEHRADVRVSPSTARATLSGQIVGTDRVAGMTVQLAPVDADDTTNEFDELTAQTSADGMFRFANLPSGQYRLTVVQFPESDVPLFSYSGDFSRTIEGFFGARPPGAASLPRLPDAPTWTADVRVTLDDQRDPDLLVTLQRGARISGRIVFDGTIKRPSPEDLPRIAVVVRPADGGRWGPGAMPAAFPQSRIERDGTFQSIGLPPAGYVLNVVSPEPALLAGWTTASIAVGGLERLGDSIEVTASDVGNVVVTLTDKTTELSGMVRDARGGIAPDARVIIFPRNPEDRDQYFAPPAPRRVRQILVDRRGQFLTLIPPGDYLVAAVTSLVPNWMAPEHLQSLVAQASAVRLEIGDRRTMSVTVR